MADPRRLLPHEVEIFVARELRKAGLELSATRVRARTRLSERDETEYSVEIGGVIRVQGVDRDVLVECRNERHPVQAAAVDALSARLPAAKAQHAMMFSTSGFEPDAVRAARTHGVPLLAVADGKTAFARSPWGMAGQPPAWVPEYMAEVVDLDVTGQLRRDLIIAGQARLILDRFGQPTSGA